MTHDEQIATAKEITELLQGTLSPRGEGVDPSAELQRGPQPNESEGLLRYVKH